MKKSKSLEKSQDIGSSVLTWTCWVTLLLIRQVSCFLSIRDRGVRFLVWIFWGWSSPCLVGLEVERSRQKLIRLEIFIKKNFFSSLGREFRGKMIQSFQYLCKCFKYLKLKISVSRYIPICLFDEIKTNSYFCTCSFKPQERYINNLLYISSPNLLQLRGGKISYKSHFYSIIHFFPF